METVQINDGPDLRLDFMGSFIQKTLKLKPEKWQRLLTFEEHKTVIKDFLDLPCHMVLVIQFTASAQLLPVTVFPLTQLKSKGELRFFQTNHQIKNQAKTFLGVYFVKRLPIEVPRDNCSSFLISGDLATRSIDQLSCLVDEIFVPLLSNTENHNGWPEVCVEKYLTLKSFKRILELEIFRVAQDVLKHVSSVIVHS